MKTKSLSLLKFISIFVSTLLFLCLSINAQEKEKAKCPEKESKENVEKGKMDKPHKDFAQKDELFKNLNLSDKQKQDLDELFKTHRENIKNIMTQLKEKNAPKEEYQETFKNARTDFDSKLAQILTNEQMGKYKEAKAEYYKQREHQEKKEQKEQVKPKRMSFEEKLNLNDEQKEKYKGISEKYKTMHKELNEKMMDEIKGILTEGQVKKLEEMKEHPKAEKIEKGEKGERGEKSEKKW